MFYHDLFSCIGDSHNENYTTNILVYMLSERNHLLYRKTLLKLISSSADPGQLRVEPQLRESSDSQPDIRLKSGDESE
ncbi:MAG: hypothetical protein J6S75_03835, partial [Thermoguttaceae bacterium]|nr:hypothetical protein [Thermoguttaceae bacterium]